MTWTCPVCGFPHLDEPAYDDEGNPSDDICPSCGFQFGWTDRDQGMTARAWRQRWLERGTPFSSARQDLVPDDWSPRRHLALRLEVAQEPPPVPCPVCGYPDLYTSRERTGEPYGLCPSCGNHLSPLDQLTPAQVLDLRDVWTAGGSQWSRPDVGPPSAWDPAAQLDAAEPLRSKDSDGGGDRRSARHGDGD